MKAKIVLIALALFAGQASAEWEIISESVKYDTYIDRSTIRKQNGYTMAWFINDYFKPDKNSTGDVYSSSKTLYVAKCGESVLDLKNYVHYSDNMGSGEIIYSSSSSEFYQLKFKDVVPGSVHEIMYNVMCGIK